MVGNVQTSVASITSMSISETSEGVSPSDLKPDRRTASVTDTNPIPAPI